jgi:hypothetical protein
MDANDKAQQELDQIERQVAVIEASTGQDEETHRQLAQLQERIHTLREDMKAPQTAWQKTELARHPQRPQTLDYIERLFTDFSEIHGDRTFGDDAAIICGMARFHGEEVLVVGTQKGRDMKQRVYRNFGTPHPEGYRKALMGVPVSGKNLFPSNIAGLPTWYTIRASKHGYVARKTEIDILIAMNAETAREDMLSLRPGRRRHLRGAAQPQAVSRRRHLLSRPFDKLTAAVCPEAKLRKLVKNMVYVGVAAQLLSIDMEGSRRPSASSSPKSKRPPT